MGAGDWTEVFPLQTFVHLSGADCAKDHKEDGGGDGDSEARPDDVVFAPEVGIGFGGTGHRISGHLGCGHHYADANVECGALSPHPKAISGAAAIGKMCVGAAAHDAQLG